MTSTFARLASAFSPPGFAIDIANVNDVRCLSVDDRHVEIEAVVCDDLECSSRRCSRWSQSTSPGRPRRGGRCRTGGSRKGRRCHGAICGGAC
jgi:hypothetical protein